MEARVRLQQIFTNRTFPPQNAEKPFSDFVNSSSIIDLSHFLNDELKSAVAQLVMLLAEAHFNSQEGTGRFRLGIILDEAHRVKGLPQVERLAREGRAWGVSLILSSQLIHKDFDEAVRGNMSTLICHGHDRDNEIVNRLAEALGWGSDHEALMNLQVFDAVILNKHHKNKLIKTLGWPHYLIYQHIFRRGPIDENDLLKVKGVHPDKLNSSALLSHMKKMGVLEVINGKVCLRKELS